MAHATGKLVYSLEVINKNVALSGLDSFKNNLVKKDSAKECVAGSVSNNLFFRERTNVGC